MKNFNNTFGLILFKKLLIVVLIQWISFPFITFSSKNFKFYHMETNFENYQELSENLRLSALEARQDFKSWWHDYQKKKNSAKLVFNSINEDKNVTNTICVFILTRNRISKMGQLPSVNYLNRLVMSILTRTKLKHAKKLSITIFNTERDGSLNDDLKQLQDLVNIRNLTKYSKIFHSNPRIKEALDFSSAAREMLKYGNKCKSFLFNEDDSLFAYDWFDLLEPEIEKFSSVNNKNKDMLMVKLFTGYKLIDIDWTKYPQAILDWIFYSSILTVLFLFIFFRNNSKHFIKVGMVLLLSSLALVFLFKSMSVSPIKRNTFFEYWVGFSMVSVLFPNKNENLLKFVSYVEEECFKFINLTSNHFSPKDILLEDFRKKNNFKEFILEPSLVQHLGMYSSLYQRDISLYGYKLMYKSYSFLDNYRLLDFDLNYLLN
jgi:hypothetical protein